MLADAQRIAMLAAMGIDTYRLRAAPLRAAPVRVGVDANACVRVDGVDNESAERLLALLPAVLGIARERVWREEAVAVTAQTGIEIDASALHGDAQARRALWNCLKPLARRLQAS